MINKFLFFIFLICICHISFAQAVFEDDSWFHQTNKVTLTIPTDNVGIGSSVPGQKVDVNGTVRATNFIGAGTGLTGTAASLNIGGNSATATNVPYSGLTGSVPIWNQNTTGNAATVTTNANLTGPMTSVGNATSITSQTGTGTKFVVDTSPTLITPIIGIATATSINKMAITAPATSSTLAVANGKTFTSNNTLTLAGTDSTTMTFPSTSATIARTDAANTFTGHQTIESVTSTGATGTGNLVFSTSPTFITPLLGTPTSGVATNLTGTASGLTAGTVSTINGLIANGTGISISGSGTSGSPYSISSSASGVVGNGTINRIAQYTGTNTVGSPTLDTIDSNGNVGIGTSTPSAPLTIQLSPPSGGLLIQNPSGTPLWTFNNGSNSPYASALMDGYNLGVERLQFDISTPSMQLFGTDGKVTVNVGQDGSSDNGIIYVSNNGVIKSLIDSAGPIYFTGSNVAIGSTGANNTLEVNGGVRIDGLTTSKIVMTDSSNNLVSASNVQDLAYCQTGGTNCPGSISGFANPTGTIGLSAVNGSATTAMRSDATPALGVTISPTMTGNWIFSPSSGNTVFTTGNVGIGTAIPPNLLYVAGTAEMQGFKMNNGASSGYVLTSNGVGIGTWAPASGGGGGGSGTVNSGTNNDVAYYNGTGTTVSGDSNVYTNGTNVGIGTYNFNNAFDVVGGVGIGITGSDTYLTTAVPAGSMILEGNVGIGTTLTTTALTVMNGNVGIGTWKPANLLAIGTNANQFQIGAGGNIAELSGNTNANMSSTIIQLNNSGGQIQLKNSGAGTNSGTLIIGSTGGTSGANIELRTSTGNDSAGFIKMTGGNSGGTEIARFTDVGNVGIGSVNPGQRLDVTGTLRLTGIGHISSNGTPPTVASNACGSTTQGVVVAKSTDISGTVTVGTLTVTSCAITFASTWQNAPVCVANDDTNVLAIRPTETTTGITFTSLSSASGDNISWICIGNE